MPNPQITALLATHPEIDAHRSQIQIVTDTLLRRPANHIPKGKMETAPEYALRLQLSPFTPHTPAGLNARIGAIFPTPPTFPPATDEETHALISRTIERAARAAMSDGFAIAIAETNNQSGKPTLQVISSGTLADLRFNGENIALVKTIENIWWAPTFHDPLEPRTLITIWSVSSKLQYLLDKDRIVQVTEDTFERGTFPGAIIKPFGSAMLGDALMLPAAAADMAAARILSDLVWTLHVLGNPILTLTTARSDTELQTLVNKATRYFTLRAGAEGLTPPEKLDFVQLDPTGIKAMHEMYREMDKRARELAGTPEQPDGHRQQQSGEAIAWKWTVGDQRTLATVREAVERLANELLDLIGEPTGMTMPPLLAAEIASSPAAQRPKT
jgi:hypothetical protein